MAIRAARHTVNAAQITPIARGVLLAAALLVGWVGHLGGDMVWGENYVLEPILKAWNGDSPSADGTQTGDAAGSGATTANTTSKSDSDAEKMGYSEEQLLWSKENEVEIWKKFVADNLLFSTDAKLGPRFINLAPFSKFYLEIDNESPGRIGQWMGWQIVRSFMDNNPEITIQQLLKMDPKLIFEKSKYKPKK
jgi:hypothetical protein